MMKKFLNYYLPISLSAILIIASAFWYESLPKIAYAAISSTPVQQAVGSVASCANFTITLGSAPTNGNLLVLTIGENTVTCHVSSISTTGVTWVSSADKYCNSVKGTEIWSGVVGAGAGTVTTVSLTGGGAGNNRGNLSEWSGTGGVLGTGTQLCSTGTATTSPTATTTPTSSLNVLIIAARAGSGTTEASLTGGFTDLTELSSTTPSSYKVVTSTSGGYQAIWTFGASSAYDTAIVVYKATAVTSSAVGGINLVANSSVNLLNSSTNIIER